MNHTDSRHWLSNAALAAAGIALCALLAASKADSRRNPPAAAPAAVEPAPPVPISTPTPEVKSWNFDQDKPDQVAQGWTAVEGDWTVLPDPTAPSPGNAFGLGAGRLFYSLIKLGEYYPIAVLSDSTEYDDFTLEASFKVTGGRLDTSGGLVLRYADPKNYYVMSAGNLDYVVFQRVSNGEHQSLKTAVAPMDQNVWYRLRVVAGEDRFSCYVGKKMVLDVIDKKFAKGRVGLWARADAQVRFDNVTLTIPPKAASAGPTPGAEVPPAPVAPEIGAPPPSLPPPMPR
jgi:hypothetical protein